MMMNERNAFDDYCSAVTANDENGIPSHLSVHLAYTANPGQQ